MFVTLLSQFEDVADFETSAVTCTQCHCTTQISGPLPKTMCCPPCGSKKLVKQSQVEYDAANGRSAA